MPPAPPEPSGGSQSVGVIAPAPNRIPSEPVQPPDPPVPLAPALVGPVEGINFDENASNTGFLQIPPDPIGAVGSNHLVSVVNSSIEWHTKSGTQLSSKRLGKNGSTFTGSFFEALSPTNSLFDPKVIYDQHSGRFLVVALERKGTAVVNATNTSRILLAASATDDPTGTWYFVAFNSKTNLSGTDYWADYPGFAVDEEAIYLTMNMFTFSSGDYGGARLWIVNKQSLYTNGPSVVFTVHDPYAAAGIGSGSTLQPAHVFGSGGVGGTAGTFLVGAGWTSGATDSINVIRVDSPLTAPSFVNQFITLGDVHDSTITFPDAPQSGTAVKIETNDERPLHAVWRSNNLYVVNTVVPPTGVNAGQATAHWYRINTTTLSSLALADQGDIGGEDIATGAHTFFPSIAVDYRGNVGIGFAASASSIFPGAYFTGRLTTDSAGTTQTAGTMAAGVDYYDRTFGGGRNRWGDYSGIALDPAADGVFLVFNEYALTRGTPGGGDGRWGTRWGSFTFNGRPASLNPGLGTATNRPATLSVVKLATEPDGDSLSFTVSATSANGGTVSLSSGTVTYTPPAGFSGTDTFTYTADDGHGGTTNGTVTVTITTGLAVSLNIVSPPAIVGPNFVVRFAGIPGRTYTIERSATVTGPWTNATNVTAPTSDTGFGIGVFEFSEATGGDTTRFFRTVYPSY